MYNDIGKTGRKIVRQITKEPVIVDFVLIFDRSGSMHGSEPYVSEGYSNILRISSDLKENIRLTTVLFDDTIIIPCERINMAEAKGIDYKIGSSTAMNDAIGATINYIEECHKNEKIEFDEKETEAAMKKRDYQIRQYVKPDVHVLIYSDGQENSSHIYTLEDIKRLIQINVKNNNYTFYYCGDYSIDAEEIAQNYGIPLPLVESYVCSEGGFKGFFRMVQRMIKELAENGKLISTWKELTKGASPLDGVKDEYIRDTFNSARKLLRTNEDILSKLEIVAINNGYNDSEFMKPYSDVMMNIGEIKKLTTILQENGYIKLHNILNDYIKKQRNQSKNVYSTAIMHSIQSILSLNLISLNKLENMTTNVTSLYNLETLYTEIITNLDKVESFINKAFTNDLTSIGYYAKNLVKEQKFRLYTALQHTLKIRRNIIKQIISQANYNSFKLTSEKVPYSIVLWGKKIFGTLKFSEEGYMDSIRIIEDAIQCYSLSNILKQMLENSNATLNEYINDDLKFNQWLEVTKLIVEN